MCSISEIDFAQILLNHVSQIERKEFLERIEGKVDNTGVSNKRTMINSTL